MVNRKWLILGVLLGVTLLMLPSLNATTFWFDEIFSMKVVRGDAYGQISLLEVLRQIVRHDVWPPLYYESLAIFGFLAGWSEFSSRYLSYLFGMVAIASAFSFGNVLGKAFFRNQTLPMGLILGLLLATSIFFTFYWHEARGYTLYVLTTIHVGWAYWYVLHAKKTKRWYYFWFTVSLIALIYTHYIATTTAIAIGLYHVVFMGRHPRFFTILKLMILAGLSYVPWIVFMVAAVLYASTLTSGKEPITIIGELMFSSSNGLPILWMIPLYLIVRFFRNDVVRFLVFWFSVSLIFALIFNEFADFLFNVRHIIGVFVSMSVLLALALVQLFNQRGLFRALAIVVLLVWIASGVVGILYTPLTRSILITSPTFPKAYIQTALQLLDDCASTDDVVIFYADSINNEWIHGMVFDYYLRDIEVQHSQIGSIPKSKDATLDLSYSERLKIYTANAPRVWYFVLQGLPENDSTVQLNTTLRQTHPHEQILVEDTLMRAVIYSQRGQSNCNSSVLKN